MLGEAIVGAIAITLDRTAKVARDQFIKTPRLSSGGPLEEHIFTRSMRHPQIALTGLSVAGIKISDRRFIDLDVGAAHHLVFDFSVDRLEPFAG
jgi:hypothetical protein